MICDARHPLKNRVLLLYERQTGITGRSDHSGEGILKLAHHEPNILNFESRPGPKELLVVQKGCPVLKWYTRYCSILDILVTVARCCTQWFMRFSVIIDKSL